MARSNESAAMAWTLLLVAGLLEVVWAYTMKLSHGFTRPGASGATIGAMIASFALLSISMRTLPLGTAYTVWTGVGAVGSFLVGIAALGEPVNVVRLAAALLIVSGIVLMKVSAS
jgi:quaternary ammonium compound-resistance protein SugE